MPPNATQPQNGPRPPAPPPQQFPSPTQTISLLGYQPPQHLIDAALGNPTHAVPAPSSR